MRDAFTSLVLGFLGGILIVAIGLQVSMPAVGAALLAFGVRG
jgi:hypothetical protein